MALTKVSRGLLTTSIVDNGNATAITIDSSENVGIATVPKAGWVTDALQLGTNLSLSEDANSAYLSANAYNSSTGWKRVNNQLAGYIRMGTNDGIFSFSNAVTGAADSAITWQERMRIDASGNLLVGGTSLTAASSIGFTAAGQIRQVFASGVANDSLFGAISGVSNGFQIVQDASNNQSYKFHNGGTPSVTIDSSGNLLVGKTSVSDTDLGAFIDPTGVLVCSRSQSANGYSSYILYSTGASAYRFYVGMGGTISATNTTISGISDVRYKENIRDLDDGLAKVMQLQPRKFDWKEGKGKDIANDRGFIAQEFEEVFPDLISEWKDPAPEGEEPYKAVRADLIPTLVKAIQEQQATIEAQATAITDLTTRLTALENT